MNVTQFHGMSSREMDGMPFLMEADLACLKMSPVPTSVIAKGQEDYVASVLARCPRWRGGKRRKLALALDRARLVREMVEKYSADRSGEGK